jgi:hypothetical protein
VGRSRGKIATVSGKHIELFLIDGTPGGLTTAEIMNWTGHVLAARRSDMSALMRRKELAGTCVYLLLGEDAGGLVRCYIGETDDFPGRLRQHNHNKDFWDRVVVVTSKDTNLTKAHGRYLESRLIALARRAGRVELDNATDPPAPSLPEAHASDMDYFIGQLQIILPVLGIDAIRVTDTQAVPPMSREALISPVFYLRQPKDRVDARAQQIDGEFMMLAGSIVVGRRHRGDGVDSTKGRAYSESTARAYSAYREKHEQLVADGSIRIDGEVGTLTKDVVFPSPSTAGAIALGRSCNGRAAWVADDKTTFGSWESRGVE